jgi:hypothetical protein
MSALFEVFFSPGKVFDQVRERSMFIPALVAVMLLTIASFAVVANMVGMETMTRKQLESNSRAAAMPQDQKEDAIRKSGSPARLFLGYGAAGIGSVIVLVVIAGISLGALSAAGGTQKFPQVLGAVSYAGVPFALLSLVMTVAILLATPDRESLDFNNMIATNIGAFLNKETTGKMLYSFAGSMDLISFAHIGLLGYAFSKVSKLSFTTCLMLVVGMWFIYVLCKSGLALFF